VRSASYLIGCRESGLRRGPVRIACRESGRFVRSRNAYAPVARSGPQLAFREQYQCDVRLLPQKRESRNRASGSGSPLSRGRAGWKGAITTRTAAVRFAGVLLARHEGWQQGNGLRRISCVERVGLKPCQVHHIVPTDEHRNAGPEKSEISGNCGDILHIASHRDCRGRGILADAVSHGVITMKSVPFPVSALMP
jgi:hypothetical protein